MKEEITIERKGDKSVFIRTLHPYKILNFNSHDIEIDEGIYDQVKWFNENGYVTGESCQGGSICRGEISPLYIIFPRLNKNQKSTLSKISKKLKNKFQTAYSYIYYYPRGSNYPHGRHIPFGMRISIKSEGNRAKLLNRVGLLNEVIAQLEQLHLKNSSKKFKAINKVFS